MSQTDSASPINTIIIKIILHTYLSMLYICNSIYIYKYVYMCGDVLGGWRLIWGILRVKSCVCAHIGWHISRLRAISIKKPQKVLSAREKVVTLHRQKETRTSQESEQVNPETHKRTSQRSQALTSAKRCDERSRPTQEQNIKQRQNIILSYRFW